MYKLKRKVSKIFETVTDTNLAFRRDGENSRQLNDGQDSCMTARMQKPNAYYDDIQLFDSHEGVECITVVDHSRIACGLESGRVMVWEISVGQQLLVLYNHHTAIKLLDAVHCEGRCTRLISVSADNLITIWDLGSGEMMKCFLLSEDPHVRLIHHISCPQYPDVVTLLFASCKLLLSQIHVRQQQDPVTTEIVGRTNAADNMLVLLESPQHIVCVSDRAVDIFEKEWDVRGKLRLVHVDIALHSDCSLYSCATLLAGDRLAVGTLFGGVYICKLNQKTQAADFYHPFISDSPVEALIMMNEEWLIVVYELSLHVVYEPTGQAEYTQLFPSALLSVRYVRDSRLILTTSKDSCKVHTWDVSNITHDRKKAWSRAAPTHLTCNGSLLAHCGLIQGLEIVKRGVVTFGEDSLVIVWRNKDAQLLKLFASIHPKDFSS